MDFFPDDFDDYVKSYTDDYIETFSEFRNDVLSKAFKTFRFGIADISMQKPTLCNLYQIVVSVNNTTLSDIQFTIYEDDDKSTLHIVKSMTPSAYRMLKLNFLLRVVLCEFAFRLQLNEITSNAMNEISAHTLCNLGFTVVKDNMRDGNNDAGNTCDDFANIGIIGNADNLSIDVILKLDLLKEGTRKLPAGISAQFDKFIAEAGEMEGNAMRRIEEKNPVPGMAPFAGGRAFGGKAGDRRESLRRESLRWESLRRESLRRESGRGENVALICLGMFVTASSAVCSSLQKH